MSLLELVLWIATTLKQMWGDFLHIQGLVVDPHVGYVQVDLLRDVEEPWGSLDREDPNGAPP